MVITGLTWESGLGARFGLGMAAASAEAGKFVTQRAVQAAYVAYKARQAGLATGAVIAGGSALAQCYEQALE